MYLIRATSVKLKTKVLTNDRMLVLKSRSFGYVKNKLERANVIKSIFKNLKKSIGPAMFDAVTSPHIVGVLCQQVYKFNHLFT